MPKMEIIVYSKYVYSMETYLPHIEDGLAEGLEALMGRHGPTI